MTAGLILNPLLLGIGFSGTALSPTLFMIQRCRSCGVSRNTAIARPSREICFTVVEQSSRYKAKNVIDTVVYRFGDVSSAWVQAGLRSLGLRSERRSGGRRERVRPLVRRLLPHSVCDTKSSAGNHPAARFKRLRQAKTVPAAFSAEAQAGDAAAVALIRCHRSRCLAESITPPCSDARRQEAWQSTVMHQRCRMRRGRKGAYTYNKFKPDGGSHPCKPLPGGEGDDRLNGGQAGPALHRLAKLKPIESDSCQFHPGFRRYGLRWRRATTGVIKVAAATMRSLLVHRRRVWTPTGVDSIDPIGGRILNP